MEWLEGDYNTLKDATPAMAKEFVSNASLTDVLAECVQQLDDPAEAQDWGGETNNAIIGWVRMVLAAAYEKVAAS